MLRSLGIACVLVMAPAIAWADAGQLSVATDSAQAAERTAEQQAAQLAAQRRQVALRYQAQLAAIDRLKKDKASWRRDRELKSALADSADTANQLAALDHQLAGASDAVARARRTAVTAIDAELASGAEGPRAGKLQELRAQLEPQPRAKKIVIPDAQIDPLADPEELDQQAAALRDSEDQLARQVAGLDIQAKDLEHVAELRKQHERAGEMMMREDDQPHLSAQHSTAAGNPNAITPPSGAVGGGASGGPGSTGDSFGGDKGISPGSFLSEASYVLGEVIDRSTIDNLSRASHSADPTQRALAAKQARDAVATRLDQLKKQRAAIEKRSKQLRAPK